MDRHSEDPEEECEEWDHPLSNIFGSKQINHVDESRRSGIRQADDDIKLKGNVPATEEQVQEEVERLVLHEGVVHRAVPEKKYGVKRKKKKEEEEEEEKEAKSKREREEKREEQERREKKKKWQYQV